MLERNSNDELVYGSSSVIISGLQDAAGAFSIECPSKNVSKGLKREK